MIFIVIRGDNFAVKFQRRLSLERFQTYNIAKDNFMPVGGDPDDFIERFDCAYPLWRKGILKWQV